MNKQLNRCPKCNYFNKVTTVDSIDNIILDAKTKCYKCGHKDYWTTGVFESELGEPDDFPE